MAILYTKTRRNASGGYETDLISSAGKDWTASFWLQHGIFSTGRRPCFVNYRGDVYVAGAYSRVLYRPKSDRRMLPAGIYPMSTKLAVANGADSGGSSGYALAYVTLLHKEGDLVLAESDRSNVVDVGASTGQGWVWSNLPPANTVDYRVTHIRGYRSMDGADYRKAWEAPIGIASFTENVLTQNLTVLGPTAGTNGVPPKGCHYMIEYGGRMLYARTAEHPYRVWRSAPGNPQYVDPNDYQDTWDRAAITGLAKGKGDCLLFVQRGAYLVRQFGQERLNDFVLDKLDTGTGCINHFGILEVHNRLWFPAEDGYWLYDGGFRYLMRDFRRYWVADYRANKLAFQTGFAYEDRAGKNIVFATGRDPAQDLGEKTDFICGTIAYVGNYESFEPSIAGANPDPEPGWTIDAYGRRNSAAYYNRDGDVLIGSCDGIIRQMDADDADDDGDTLLKAVLIRHGHNLYQRPGDDAESGGKTLTDFWVYVEAEFNAWTLYLLGGDEHSWNRVRPDNVWGFFRRTIAASLLTAVKTVGTVTKTLRFLPKTVHVFGIPPRVTGRGWTTEIRATSPLRMIYRGYGGAFGPGPATREAEIETTFVMAVQWRVQGESIWQDSPVAALVRTQAANVTLELRLHFTDDYSVVLPVDLLLDYSGTNMPVDASDQITVGSAKIRTEVFTDAGVTASSGSLSLAAEDAGNVPAKNSPLAVAVSVATWDVELQYRIDAGAWTDYAATIVLAVAQTLELRAQVFGSKYPTSLRQTLGANPVQEQANIVAPGTYISHVEPSLGVGTHNGFLHYYNHGTPGAVAPLVSIPFSVQWTP